MGDVSARQYRGSDGDRVGGNADAHFGGQHVRQQQICAAIVEEQQFAGPNARLCMFMARNSVESE